MYYSCIIMVYKNIKIDDDTNDILDNCIKEFLTHHPELMKIKISRNKIIYEMAKFYLR